MHPSANRNALLHTTGHSGANLWVGLRNQAPESHARSRRLSRMEFLQGVRPRLRRQDPRDVRHIPTSPLSSVTMGR